MNQPFYTATSRLFLQSSSVRVFDWCITGGMTSSSSDAHVPAVIDTSVSFWERACVVRMDHGSPDAFNPLVEYYSARIYTHLYRMVRNREEAEDLTQETFVLAYRKIGSYDRTRPFRNWLYTIATNVGRNALRARARRIPALHDASEADAAVAKDSGETQIERLDLKDRLASVVDQLPDPLPALIQLHYQEGLTIREAAVILDMTEGAAKVALHRARKTLRTMLRKD
jgi:RNA polymerase sigma-70 factor (ECF subfamily)